MSEVSREPIEIELWTNLQLTREEKDSLWDQGVNMDDWDYMLIVALDEAVVNSYGDVCATYPLERLLSGCCDNKWYSPVIFRGKKVTIGVAYHA